MQLLPPFTMTTKMTSMPSTKVLTLTPQLRLHPPFELFLTSVRYGTGTNQVATHTLGIKTNVAHGNLLHELLLWMANTTMDNLHLKYVPIGTANIIGPEPYKQLICDNNAYLSSLATIPVMGMSDKTLHLCIPVQHPNKPETQMTIKDIILSNKWCVNIKPTQQEGKIFILMMKAMIDDGCQWLDANLLPIFTNYLNKHPDFVPNPDQPIAQHDDQIQHNPTLADYANALKHSLSKTPNQPTQQCSKYTRPPPIQAPPLVTISYKAAATKSNQTAQPENAKTTQQKNKKQKNTNNHSQAMDITTNNTSAQTQTINIADLKQDILNFICQDMAKFTQCKLNPLKQER